MRQTRRTPIRLAFPRPKKVAWHHISLAVAVIATGVASGTSYVQATGSLTVNTIWQHTPIAWTDITNSSGASSISATTGAWLAWDPGDQYTLLMTPAGGLAGSYKFLANSFTLLAPSCSTCPPSGTTYAIGTDFQGGASSGYGAEIELYGGTTSDMCQFSVVNSANFAGSPDWICFTGNAFTLAAGAPMGAYAPWTFPAFSSITRGGDVFLDSGGAVWLYSPNVAPAAVSVTCSSTGGGTLCPAIGTGEAFAWDPVDGYDVLFDSNGNTWSYVTTGATKSGATVVYHGVFTQLSPSSSPSARTGASFAYYGACGYDVLFGGEATVGGKILADTWKFHAGSWTQLSPTERPTARYGAAMDYDQADGELVLFGGTAYNGIGGTTATNSAFYLSPGVGGCP